MTGRPANKITFSSTKTESAPTEDFYASVRPFDNFSQIAHFDRYLPLPDDWFLGIADVAQSTKAIKTGRYKAVNTVGAAVLVAITNALPNLSFPYVFGGDGATVAIPGKHLDTVKYALAQTAAWADDTLDLLLRVAIVPLWAIRAAGHDVRTARYAASDNVSYAMFSGGGVAWAERQLKKGQFGISPATSNAKPDLSGLYCGFGPIPTEHGTILSIIAIPFGEQRSYAALVADVLALIEFSSHRSGHPLPERGPLPPWLGGKLPRLLSKRLPHTNLLTALADGLRAIKTRAILSAGIRIGRFDPLDYRRNISKNTDFRKFDDGLKMTVDCSLEIADAIEARLLSAQLSGICVAATHRQTSAYLTCYISSNIRSDHVHFVDGADGGYAAAAAKLKSGKAASMREEA
ncbi:hypothetical protein EDE08_11741 [Bradyrhizobium sp. R2.2-H]|jgi:hypothetical protein|uniref:DUF3095 domain-containing protein n=1 Tax=unclassified Bradyrhizobium TaxID=2631580 RepID=UPI001043AE4C|nr:MULTISPECIES: DUF3095 domain-containing protein [unclassified Bradyrhizobium]TCU64052.1 hypothetical protein EDE10_117105 [Bradyrhizobium sp. Y-H1]TCU65858.1 hypothetical protein EDE08_11741 [Bradyrhizobium sp. R2.2-H]